MLTLRLLIAICLASFASSAQAEDVTIFAAASLKTALDEVLQNKDVTVSYAGSSTLARQVALGAPADLVLTANAAWMDHLASEGRIEPQTRVDLLSNRLVLVASSDMMFIMQADRPVDDIIGGARVAMALVDAVPAGIYGKEALTALNIWQVISPNVVQTDNVRSALRFVAMGEIPFGIVYQSDARAEPRVQIVHAFDPARHSEIVYPMAIVAGQINAPVAAIWAHLQSAEAQAIFERHGFLPSDGAP